MSETSSQPPLPLYCRAPNASDATAITAADLRSAEYHSDTAAQRKSIVVMIPGYPDDIAQDYPTFRGLLSPEDPTVGEQVKKKFLSSIKTAESLLGAAAKDTHIFSMLYSHVPNLKEAGLYFAGERDKLHGDKGPDDEQLFVNQVLLPIAGITQEKRPDVDSVCQNLSRLTIVVHSLGCGFALRVAERFRTTLQSYGYDDTDINRIVREPVVVALANGFSLNPKQVNPPGFRTVGFSGSYDRRIGYGLKALDEVNWQAKYTAAGYDPNILVEREHAIAQAPYSPNRESAKLLVQSSANGITYFGDLPSHLEWKETQLDGTEASRDLKGTKAPEHYLKMFTQRDQRAKSENPLNSLMVTGVQKAVQNLMKRGVSQAHSKVYLPNNDPLQEPFRKEIFTVVNDLGTGRQLTAA